MQVVRLWDSRSGQRIAKLTGHTDNIRALVFSDDGDMVGVTTIKLQRSITVSDKLHRFLGTVRIIRFYDQAMVRAGAPMSQNLYLPSRKYMDFSQRLSAIESLFCWQ